MRVLRYVVAGLALTWALCALTGCRISTPDTADSGTGFEFEAFSPWNRDCPKPEKGE